MPVDRVQQPAEVGDGVDAELGLGAVHGTAGEAPPAPPRTRAATGPGPGRSARAIRHASGWTPRSGSAAITASLPTFASSSSATSASTGRDLRALGRRGARRRPRSPRPRPSCRLPAAVQPVALDPRRRTAPASRLTPTVSRWPLSTTVGPPVGSAWHRHQAGAVRLGPAPPWCRSRPPSNRRAQVLDDLRLTASAGHEPRVHAVDRDQLLQQPHRCHLDLAHGRERIESGPGG